MNHRLSKHNTDIKDPRSAVHEHFNELGIENMKYEIIEHCKNITNADELKERERFHLGNFKDDPNCLNIVMPIVSKEERQNNRNKVYRCECGYIYSYVHKTRHMNTIVHKTIIDNLKNGIKMYKCECGIYLSANINNHDIREHEKSSIHKRAMEFNK